MKTKITTLAFLVVTAGAFALLQTKNHIPSDFRDAIADNMKSKDFDTALPILDKDNVEFPVPKPERAVIVEVKEETGHYVVQNPVGSSLVTADNRTGLMWITNPVDAGIGDIYGWREALHICRRLEYAGHTDWRMPSSNELLSLYVRKSSPPNIDTRYFQNISSGYYWTVTPYPDSGIVSRVSTVNFYGGGDYYASRIFNKHNLLCVRTNL